MDARAGPVGTGGPTVGPTVLGRALLLAVLALAVALGLHGGVPGADWGRYPRLHDAEALGGLEAMLVALLYVLWRRGRVALPRPAEAAIAARLRTVLNYVLAPVAAAVAAALALLLANPSAPPATGHGSTPAPAPKALPPNPLPRAAPPSGGAFPFTDIFYGLGAAVVLAAAAWLALRLARQYGDRPSPGPFPAPEAPRPVLEEAVAEGHRALVALDDARAAIIACYKAMEAALARAGTERSAAETPDELLEKAAGALLVDRRDASELTALFYEARFSSHEMGDDSRSSAEKALGGLAAQLARRRPASTLPGAGAP